MQVAFVSGNTYPGPGGDKEVFTGMKGIKGIRKSIAESLSSPPSL